MSRFIVEPIGQYAVDPRQVRPHYNGQEFELHLVILSRHRRLATVDYMPYNFRQIDAGQPRGRSRTSSPHTFRTFYPKSRLGDARILCMEKTVGTVLYRNILREYGLVNQPKLIRDPAVKRTVLQMLEPARRGIELLDAVTKRLGPLPGLLFHLFDHGE